MDQRQFIKTLRQNMTDAEQLLWRHLRAHRMDGQKFRRQQPLGILCTNPRLMCLQGPEAQTIQT